MSSPAQRPPFYVESSLAQVRQHHRSIKDLWETKWKAPCSRGIYPFVDGKLEDFEPVFRSLIEQDLREPYDPDVYAAAFFPPAEALEKQAAGERAAGQPDAAAALELRAAALYRIARFPTVRSAKTEEAWRRNKAAYLRASPQLDPPSVEVTIPHMHGVEGEGTVIPAYLRLPAGAASGAPVPVVIFICGLDAYRTDHTNRTSEHARRGFACLSVEIPGTGDSPALRGDPSSPDRVWSSVLDWLAAQPELDAARVTARGVSTGGYYAMRIAHTHAERLVAAVAQGGGCHYMFHADWIEAQDAMEYPFYLAEAVASKFGYADMQRWKSEAMARYSLLEGGILEKKSCRLLLINGTNDEIFPIEDSELLLRHGDVKDARFIEGRFHMGNPEAEGILYAWLDQFK